MKLPALRLLWASLLMAMFSGQAHAQLDYSAYGVLDFSYGRFETSGNLHSNRFNSNSLSASFVGVNVKQGFDGGWTPGVTLETFLRFQDFKTGRRDSDPTLSRNAFVSLNSDYGFVRWGRLQTFLFDATNRFNAFANSPSFSPPLRHTFLSGNIEGVQGDFYWDNALSYQSPNLDGLSLSAMSARGRGAQKGRYGAGTAIYARGALGLNGSFQSVKIDDGINNPTNENVTQLGVTYNFGLLRWFSQFTGTQDTGLEVRSNSLASGIVVPFGDGNVLAQMASTRSRGPAVDRRHLSLALGYVYNFDSITDFYVLGLDDRVGGQTRGLSVALGGRYKF
jgi:Gram-negative porin